jgi:membrane peptidoglycan carboxypeptidase
MARARTDGLPASKVVSHLGVMLLVSVVLGVVVSGLAIPFAGVLGFTARNMSESIDELPQELETELLPQRTEILDRNGDTIATIYDENRVIVPLRQISRTMVKAIVSIEDYRFYQHGALDVRGTMRALFTNQANDGVVQGGSSITQQLVKLTLLTQADTKAERKAATDDTYARKLRELRYAIALEKKYSKDWILERYLNTAYFGDGAYGIQAAAQHYFNVNAKDLDLRQSALLAGIVQSPGAFDPTNNPERAKARRDVVLDRMAELSVISEKRAEKTRKMKLGLDVKKKARGCVNSTAQFFCEYVIAWLKQDPALGNNPRERWQLVENGGLTITTTLDLRMQEAAEKSVTSRVFPQESVIGALALVEPGTGEVKALAQSRQLGRGPGQTFLNYTVPKEYGKANGFQPGSNFKTFVLASAINQGIPLNTTISAPAQRFIPENEYEVCNGEQYQSSATWDVSNYDSASHTANLYTGTQLSINTFFAELERRTGLCEPYKLAERLGIKIGDPDRFMVPSFTLGVADVSPLEMAEAYATFAARGMHCDSRPVTKIEDNQGNTLNTYEPKCTQEIGKPVADAVNDVLEGVVSGSGFAAAQYPGQQAAGKTGTTTDNTAVWFTGYTPNLAGAATVAGVTPAGEPDTLDGKSIGGIVSSTSGSGTAAPIWGDAFKAIAPFLPDETFVEPTSKDISGLLKYVPDVAGQSYESAAAEIEAAGLTPVDGGSDYSGYAEGTVAYTYPGVGAALGPGDQVTVVISAGPPPKRPPRGDNNGGGNNGGGNDGGGNNNGGGNNGGGRGGGRG